MAILVGSANVAKPVNNLTVGVSGVARPVVSASIGVGGVARPFYPVAAPIASSLTLTFSQIASPLVIYPGSNSEYTALLPLTIEWGNGDITMYGAGSTIPATITHTYSSSAARTVTINGHINLLRSATSDYSLVSSTNRSYLTSCTGSLGAISDLELVGNTISNYLSGMFYGCTSLTSVPTMRSIPNFQFITDIYNYLYCTFMGCTSLTVQPTIPALPSSVTDVYVYLGSTFRNTGITEGGTIPALPSSVVYISHYLYQLYCMAAITAPPAIPALPSTATTVANYLYMTFYSSNLVSAPYIPPLPSSITSTSNYLYYTFRDCTHLTTIPSSFVFDSKVSASDAGNMEYTFYNAGTSASGINRTATAIINGIAAPSTDKNTFSTAFSDYSSLAANWKQ